MQKDIYVIYTKVDGLLNRAIAIPASSKEKAIEKVKKQLRDDETIYKIDQKKGC